MFYEYRIPTDLKERGRNFLRSFKSTKYKNRQVCRNQVHEKPLRQHWASEQAQRDTGSQEAESASLNYQALRSSLVSVQNILIKIQISNADLIKILIYTFIFCSDEPTGRLALVFELMDMNMYDAVKGKRHYLPENRVKYYMY